MRTSRILEMIYLLLNKRQQTAEELANHFGVSVKTIYRDVDTLAEAGVPISKQQGVNGGVVLDDKYALNKSKLTKSEEAALMSALEGIKKLPNAQLDYALKLMKQYFNEAATMWINADDISLEVQEKFHMIKRAAIEKNVMRFHYFVNGDFHKCIAEPYELRIKDDVWKLLLRDTQKNVFEEVYVSRMTNIIVTNKHFTRRELPKLYCKKNDRNVKVLVFEVLELTDDILNRFPIDDFDFTKEKVMLNVKVGTIEDGQNIQRKHHDLKLLSR